MRATNRYKAGMQSSPAVLRDIALSPGSGIFLLQVSPGMGDCGRREVDSVDGFVDTGGQCLEEVI